MSCFSCHWCLFTLVDPRVDVLSASSWRNIHRLLKDRCNFERLATAFLPKEKTATLEKSMVKMLLSIAQSDRERECVRYTIYKASGMTPTALRQAFGFENMKLRETKVEEAVYEIQKIHETFFNLAAVEDEALLMRFGIKVQADSSSDDSEEEEITPEDSDRLFLSPDSVHFIRLRSGLGAPEVEVKFVSEIKFSPYLKAIRCCSPYTPMYSGG